MPANRFFTLLPIERLRACARVFGRVVAFATWLWPMAMASAATPTAAPSEPHDSSQRDSNQRDSGQRDWRDEILYFAMIDRFDDGDPGNNDQGAGEYDPRDGRKFSGGDLAGLERRLDYIRGLGATAVWITPPVANQWWNDKSQYGGYHGYWASNFKSVDAHFGTLPDYRRLADAMHARGLRLVQDIVVNHTADYFGYRDGVTPDPQRPQRGFVLRRQYDGASAPTQAPFDRNDARKPADRAAAVYHWTPVIRDFSDHDQELNWQLAELDDLNTENPAVRAALRDSYGFWIREAGVDGFRVDTAFYVPPEFFTDFLHADDPRAPGVMRVAATAGRPDFHVFGEGFGLDKPYRTEMARKIEAYARDADGQRLLPGMINFPLYGTLGDVFARGHAPAELGYRIVDMMKVHADPWRMPTFVDNHDVDRFLAGGDEAGLKQALLAIMALPGIPTIYYGTEQGLREQRGAMFAGGYGADGRDRFETEAPLYHYLQRAIGLRRTHRLFSRGRPQMLIANPARPGALAWRTDFEGASALVVFNTGDRETLLDALPTGLPGDIRLRPIFAIDGEAPTLRTGPDGRLDLVLPPRAGLVWLAETGVGARMERARMGTPTSLLMSVPGTPPAPRGMGKSKPGTPTYKTADYSGTPTETARSPMAAGAGTPTPLLLSAPVSSAQGTPTSPKEMGKSKSGTPTYKEIEVGDTHLSTDLGTPTETTGPPITIDPTTPTELRGDFELGGLAPGAQALRIVVDGELEGAQTIRPDATGRWHATVRTDDMLDPGVIHRVVAWDPARRQASTGHAFKVDRAWTLVAEAEDPAGDDRGPNGRYTYPDDPSWRGPRPADLLGARVFASGGALRLQLRMREVVAGWNPANGFDHVVFTVFIGLPGREDGAVAMPQQDASLPHGMRWHLRLRAHGWSNALSDSEGASNALEGRQTGEAARIDVDPEADTVSFTLPARALGRLGSLSGLRLHITTWDYDGGYRPLAPRAGAHHFGGGQPDDPKVMDDLSIHVE